MITAKGDGTFEDFLQWAVEAGHGHYVVTSAYTNYRKYCEYIRENKNQLAEKQRYVEE